MKIKDWPEEDRPREKLLRHGEARLTDAELIAILLNTGIRDKTAVDIAKEILVEAGSLKKLLAIPQSLLIKKPGIGRVKYTRLRAAIELGRRYLNTNISVGQIFNNSQAIQRYLTERLREKTTEVFACLFMDIQLRLISFEELFQGTVSEAVVYPREIVRRGLALNASNVIFAHNHPSGSSFPSQADKEMTSLIKEALYLVEINVIDHIIVGNLNSFSFAEAGLL